MPSGRPMVLTVLLIVACCVGAGAWAWWTFFDAYYHLETVRDGILYRDGVRNLSEFDHAVKRVSPRTVVSLVDDNEIAKAPFTGELDYCRANHIELVRIPIPLGGWPNERQVKQFLALVADPARRPVLVHCAQGVRRTGMMVAAYQESAMNFTAEQAKAAILTFGHSQRTVGDVQRFIDVYDPAGQRMTEQLPMSSE